MSLLRAPLEPLSLSKLKSWLLFSLVVGGALLLGATLAIDVHGRTDETKRAKAIVLLGARVDEGGIASPTLRARATWAAQLFADGKAPLLVLSGGVGTHAPSEAAIARELVTRVGVPYAACLLEEHSHTTEQNARLTAVLLRARGIDEVILVSDPYHLYRARQYFWREGIRVQQSPVFDAPRDRDVFQRVEWTVREVFAVAAHPSLLLVTEPPR